MVEFGCIDLHVWTSRADKPDRADVVLFDVDPAGVGFEEVVDAALRLRDALEMLELDSIPMTTGGDGMHVRVPIARRHSYPPGTRVRRRRRARAGALERRHGVFIDTKMNGHGQQIVAPYSIRPLERPAIATPLRWDEVDEQLDPRRFGVEEVLERFERDGDLAATLLGGRQRLAPALAKPA